ncbi:MAG: type I restriction endonuclease [Methanosarcinaceae archaeon]|nr:type I restriction endonuclease [Methanosarcinaceae archaeon]
MDFIDQIKELAARIPKLRDNIKTEEATKNALVMPLINILGYNVFNPSEVVPEYTADFGTKKGEKVDYAIFKDGNPVILIECKNIDADLDRVHASQLFRYFSVTEAKIGILTNGIVYRFYTDLDSPNKMDEKSFLEINLMEIKEPLIQELKRFKKESFDIDDLAPIACDMKYTREIKQILSNETNSPSEDFVKFFAKQVHNGPFTQKVRENFTGITKNAFSQFINEKINERLKFAMSEDSSLIGIKETGKEEVNEGLVDEKNDSNDGIVTTEEEIEGYYIVKSIICKTIDPKRVFIRDKKSYCGILLDDNNRKPICRLHFNTSQKYLELFADKDRNAEKIPISELNEIYNYSEQLLITVNNYDGSL